MKSGCVRSPEAHLLGVREKGNRWTFSRAEFCGDQADGALGARRSSLAPPPPTSSENLDNLTPSSAKRRRTEGTQHRGPLRVTHGSTRTHLGMKFYTGHLVRRGSYICRPLSLRHKITNTE